MSAGSNDGSRLKASLLGLRPGLGLGRAVLAASLSVALAGCFGLGKREDATAEVDAVHRFALSLQQQSSVSRASGQATWVRLTHLFPGGTTNLQPQDFAFQGAQGLNQAFGAEARPYESLAQMALRSKAAVLCKTLASDSDSLLFKLDAGDQLLSGETAPADPATALALAAARNAWLHPYLASDAEVQELASLYNTAKASSSDEGGDAGGKRALCMAVLLAPQFWMGNPYPDDAAKRVSLELFRRVPPMQEMQDFDDKKITLSDYFDKLLAAQDSRSGFVSTMHEWHEEWLGLRTFIDPGVVYEDRRPSLIDPSGGGASNAMTVTFGVDNGPFGASGFGGPAAGPAGQTIAPARQAGLTASRCVSPSAQDFDPDTSMVAWEHYNYDAGKFEFVGGFIRTGGALQAAHFSATDLSEDDVAAALAGISLMPYSDSGTRRAAIQDLCGASGNQISDQEGVVWNRCDGLLSLTSAGGQRALATMQGLFTSIDNYDSYRQEDMNGAQIHPYCATNPNPAACVTAYQNYYKAVRNIYIDDLYQLVFRIKAYTSSGVTRAAVHATLTSIWASASTEKHDGFMAQESTLKSQVNDFGATIQQGGWFYGTSLSEMKNPSLAGADSGGVSRYTYNYGGFDHFSLYLGANSNNKTLPLIDLASSVHGYSPQDRRVRRLGGQTGQWQDGYSSVSLWWTGGSVKVCNTMDRFWASCFLRPRAVRVPGGDIASFRPDLGKMWSSFYAWYADDAAHPQILTAFYCGLPSHDELRTFDPQNPNAAYEAHKFGPLNPTAVNIDLQGGGNEPASSPAGNEVLAYKDVASQLSQEPYRLIEHLILDKADYRELLTADYTVGNGCLQFFYDTQGYYLPRHDTLTSASCTGPGMPDTQFGAGAPIPMGYLTAVNGSHAGDTAARSDMWRKLYGGAPSQLPPRLYSGILSMPAFIAPVATGARSIASRYFARLLCDQPNFYDPSKDPVDSADKVTLHTGFISQRRHLQQACLQCHQNLDPLASAFSWTFQGLLEPDPNDPGFKTNAHGGEGSANDFLGEIDLATMKTGDMEGVRNGGAPPSAGAFMGQPVSGIAGLGQAVANSDKFAQCVTSTVFENVFGRQVQIADAQFFKDLVAAFKDPAKANYRYLDLIKIMITSDNYQRKN